MSCRYPITLLLIAGCTGTIGDEEREPLAEWRLVANERQALTDPGEPDVGYPNPNGCATLDVTLEPNGLLCGLCTGADGDVSQSCGGPTAGIPYFVLPSTAGAQLDVGVFDLFGDLVVELQALADTCIDTQLPAGGTCSICTSAGGTLSSDGCDGLFDAELPTQPQQPQDPSTPSDPVQAHPVDPSDPTPLTDSFQAGVDAFEAELNARLAAMELPAYDVPASRSTPFGVNFGAQTCFFFGSAELEAPDGNYMNAGQLRCGAIGEDALTVACQAGPPEGADAAEFNAGLGYAYAEWSGNAATDFGNPFAPPPTCSPEDPSCETTPPAESPYPECTGSPLVLATGGTISLTPRNHGTTFDLYGTGVRLETGWVAEGALLVLDRNFDGRITDGRELFGEATLLAAGGLASHGFAALAQHDEVALGGNGDGRIDAGDTVYALLELWRDADLDGETDAGELTALEAAGIAGIELGFTALLEAESGGAGNRIELESSFEWVDGHTAPIYDVYFRYGRATNGS